MFKKHREKLRDMTDAHNAFDPSQIGDPVAKQTKWEPVSNNGILFWINKLFKGTRELVEINPERIEFKAPKVKRICLVVIGAAMFIFIQLIILFQDGKGVIVIPLPVYPAIVLIAGCLLYFGTAPIVFDKHKGVFLKGRKVPWRFGGNKELKYFAKLADIHAFQLISDYSEETNSYINCQLNLVLKDGSRINVADYKHQKKLQEDARTLSAFLGKPVWNGFKTFDPSSTGDPISMNTEWNPVESGRASFWTNDIMRITRKLVEIDHNRMEFRMSREAISMFFLIMVLGILIGTSNFFVFKKIAFGSADLLFGIAFIVGGCCLLYLGNTPIIFDKYKDYFWKGRKMPDEMSNKEEFKYFSKITNIYALQLISKYCETGRGNTYYSYQLNLVLKNGNRINVVEYRNLKRLREDAQVLSTFLGKPVWDAT